MAPRKQSFASKLKELGLKAKKEDGDDEFSIEVFQIASGKRVGSLFAVRKGPEHLKVNEIHVNPFYRRQKLGTALYELLQKKACAEGRQVISDELRSHFAEGFWRKQESKGRATCIDDIRKGGVYLTPLADMESEWRKECDFELDPDTSTQADADACFENKKREAMKRFPQPEQGKYGTFWPCNIWALKPTNCGKPLDGLKRSKKSKKKR
jgi:GNAT superfamily N-acetyltransferase